MIPCLTLITPVRRPTISTAPYTCSVSFVTHIGHVAVATAPLITVFAKPTRFTQKTYKTQFVNEKSGNYNENHTHIVDLQNTFKKLFTQALVKTGN